MEIKPSSQIVGNYDIQFGGFDKLMPRRVRDVLLVAAPYDSFLLADDDRLTELVFSEYLDLNLRYSPRVTRVSTAEEALKRIAGEKFDLIITMAQVGDIHIAAFAKEVKKALTSLPVILLCFNTPDILQLTEEEKNAFDKIFLWLGDPRIFVAIIKLVEDKLNIDHDTALSGVQTVILIEDSVRFYSSYLPIIYTELMKQTQLVMADGINISHKMLRMRARPKILLATTFEEAWELYDKYRLNVLGIITDVQFLYGGRMDPQAGLTFAERVKADNPDTPVLVQSSDGAFAGKAEAVGAAFLNKCAPDLLKQLQGFILEYFGFGDFKFRLAGGREVGRASDLRSMTELLKSVPEESIVYHASRNHFSKWLMARTEFEIAYHLRPRRISEFKDINGLRKYLIEILNRFVHKTQLGEVIPFDGRSFDGESPFVKIGSGSLGGKARGLAFMNFLLSKTDFSRRFEGVNITVPNTVVLATDVFDFFMEENEIYPAVRAEKDNAELSGLFARAKLPAYVVKNLKTLVERVNSPLAVRSSSLLEDSRAQPFAGVYKTYMLANNHPDAEVRLEQLCRAIKFVYASTFSAEARSYLKLTTHLPDEEKMAVIVQLIAGNHYDNGKRFYPLISGLAQSYNYYPVPPMRPEDGLAYVALGLGKTIMDGHRVLRFSPRHPHNLHQFSTVSDFLSNSQREFMAVDTGTLSGGLEYELDSNIIKLEIDAAEADGTLSFVGSTYSPDNDAIYDDVSRPGTRLITFAPVLKNGNIPLAEILQFFMEVGVDAMGSHIEMEFAVNPSRSVGRPAEFSILQMRPMISRQSNQKVSLEGVRESDIICETSKTLGNGYINGVRDILYVKPQDFNPAETAAIAAQIGEINRTLRQEGRSCLLIGPGRWGSSDPWLGIPVKWNQISSSRVIVETTLEGFVVDPSYGAHFFHNVTSLGIGYFTVNRFKNEGFIDWEWLSRQAHIYESRQLRHIRMEKPLDMRIDGSSGKGVILKPA